MEAAPIAILIAVAIIESILSLSWAKLYFTTGIPVFSRELNAFSPGAPVPTAEELSARLARSKYPPLIFHDLGGNRFAFREKAWTGFSRFTYTPVMRGLLAFDPLQAKVRVTGRANWFTLLFSLAFLLPFLSWHTPVLALLPFLLFLVGLLALIYRIQAGRFTEAATAAVNAWSTVVHAS